MDLPDGYFDENDVTVYGELYQALPLRSKTAELGTWKGRSLCSVADIILDRGIDVPELPKLPINTARFRHVSVSLSAAEKHRYKGYCAKHAPEYQSIT